MHDVGSAPVDRMVFLEEDTFLATDEAVFRIIGRGRPPHVALPALVFHRVGENRIHFRPPLRRRRARRLR